MPKAYKIYASILNERMKKEIEGKLMEGQFDFRTGRETIDAIYELNRIVNSEIEKRGGKLFTCFVDLRAAFDKIDRNLLMERLKKMEIERNLKNRVAEIYIETW